MTRNQKSVCRVADETLRRVFALFECPLGGMLRVDVPLLLFSLDIPNPADSDVLNELVATIGATYEDRLTLAETRQLVHQLSVQPGSIEEATRVYESLLRRRTTVPDDNAAADSESLTASELRAFLQSVAGPSNSRCVERAVQLCDRDGTGTVRLEDWTAVVECANQLGRAA